MDVDRFLDMEVCVDLIEGLDTQLMLDNKFICIIETHRCQKFRY